MIAKIKLFIVLLVVALFPEVAIYLLFPLSVFKIFGVVFLLMTFMLAVFADKLLLEFLDARELDKRDLADLYQVIKKTCYYLKMGVPSVYRYSGDIPNSMALGFSRNKASVLIESSLFEKLSREELEAVLINRLVSIKYQNLGLLTFVTLLGFLARKKVRMIKNILVSIFKIGNGRAGAIALVILSFLYPVIDFFVWFAQTPAVINEIDLVTCKICGGYMNLESAMYKILHMGKGDTLRDGVWAPNYFVDNVTTEHLFNIFDGMPMVDDRLDFVRQHFKG